MRKLLEYLPFHFLCSLILGILAQYHFSFLKGPVWILILLFSILLLVVYITKPRKGFEILVFVSFFFFGASFTYLNDDRNQADYYENFLHPDNFLKLEISEVLKSTNYYNKYKAKIVEVDEQKTNGLVLVHIKKDSISQKLEVGEIIYTKQLVKSLKQPKNPHQFDYKDYLEKQGIYNQVYLDNTNFLSADAYQSSIIRFAFKSRTHIQNSLSKYHFSHDEYGVINALLLGEKQEVSKELMNDYAKAGAIHILAISGLHVGILLLLFSFVLKPLERLPKGKLIKAFCIVFALWSFALLAGMSASVVRAVTMFSIVALGQSFQRKSKIEHSLVISMLILLFFKPMFLFDVGFQMSYLAVFAIVWIQPKLASIWKSKYKIVNYYWQLITVSIAAQVGVLPISLYYFHQFPGLFIISNLIIIPFLGVILGLGIFIIVLSLLTILPQFLADFYEKIIHLMNQVIEWVAHQESFLITDISFSKLMLISSYFVIAMALLCFNNFKANSVYRFLFSILLFQFVMIYKKVELQMKSEMVVFHKHKGTLIGERVGSNVLFYQDSIGMDDMQRIVKPYQVGEHVNVALVGKIPSYFKQKSQSILIIDNENLYPELNIESPILIFINSPKINLDRVIREIQPSYIVADGSNYKSYVEHWRKTCIKTKTPFWFVSQKGVFYIR